MTYIKKNSERLCALSRFNKKTQETVLKRICIKLSLATDDVRTRMFRNFTGCYFCLETFYPAEPGLVFGFCVALVMSDDYRAMSISIVGSGSEPGSGCFLDYEAF